MTVVQPQAQSNLSTSLFANAVTDTLDKAPGGAAASLASQVLERAGSSTGDEVEERDEEDAHFPIRSIRTRDYFEDTPRGAISVRTLDPFDDDTAAKDVSGDLFGHPMDFGMPSSLPLHQAEVQPPPAEPVRSALGGSAAAEIKVRNTFVHFSDDEEEDTPRLHGVSRRSRATRTVPARILEGALVHEDGDSEHGQRTTPPESKSPQQPEAQPLFDNLPTLLHRQPPSPAVDVHKAARPCESATGPGPWAVSIAAEAAAAAKAAAVAAAAAAAAAAAVKPNRERGQAAVAAEDSTPWPMYVEQTPSALKGMPQKPQHGEQAPSTRKAEPHRQRHAEGGEGGPAPKLTFSVRNTFVHIDEEEGEEQTPAPHRRGSRRSKTGPAVVHVLDESDEGSEEVDGAGCFAAAQPPCKVPVAQPQQVPAQATQPGQAAVMAGGMAMPSGMCTPIPMQLGVMPPFLPGLHPWAPFLAQMSAAQAMTGQQAVLQAGPPPEANAAAGGAAVASASPRRPPSERTTVVLQNLPLNYRRAMLLRMLDAEGFAGHYDFVYLPMDFKTRAGFGYAFINIVDPSLVNWFWAVFDGYKKWMFPSAKVCRVSWSVPHQGLKAHIKRYRNSPLMHESVPDEYRPVLFSGGVRVAFPPPTKDLAAPSQKVLAKAPKGGRRQQAA